MIHYQDRAQPQVVPPLGMDEQIVFSYCTKPGQAGRVFREYAAFFDLIGQGLSLDVISILQPFDQYI